MSDDDGAPPPHIAKYLRDPTLVVHPRFVERLKEVYPNVVAYQHVEKAPVVIHTPITQGSRTICTCGDYDCPILDVLRENLPQNKNPIPLNPWEWPPE